MENTDIQDAERKLKILWFIMSKEERTKYLQILYEKYPSYRKIGTLIKKSKSTIGNYLRGSIKRHKKTKNTPKPFKFILDSKTYNKGRYVFSQKNLDFDMYVKKEIEDLLNKIKELIDNELRI